MNSNLFSRRDRVALCAGAMMVLLTLALVARAGETPAIPGAQPPPPRIVLPAASPADQPPPAGAKGQNWNEITLHYDPADVAKWKTIEVDGAACLISPVLEKPAGDEINHYRVTIVYEGSGSALFSVLHAPSGDLDGALKQPYLRSPFAAIKSGQEMPVASPYKGECCAWLLLRASGEAKVRSVQFSCWHAKGTLYGHVARTFEFDGGKLPYRLMYPRNYDPAKSYPLVLSVSGSGGVGHDNASNMEMVILARSLFTDYYADPELECFSLVPQIPKDAGDVPAGYFPKGPKGRPTEFHPDWPMVNENGWYVQATLALIQSLLHDPALKIDADRVYYTGFSYGGKACWEFLKAGREVFAGAICGAGWPIGPVGTAPQGALAERLKLEVQRYKHIPVVIFAGEKDPMMRPGSPVVAKEIVAQGGKATYVEVPGADHVGSSGTWTDRKQIAWLFQQNRGKNPKPGADPFPGGEYGQAQAN